jgi:hypothetical protein
LGGWYGEEGRGKEEEGERKLDTKRSKCVCSVGWQRERERGGGREGKRERGREGERGGERVHACAHDNTRQEGHNGAGRTLEKKIKNIHKKKRDP